MKKIIMWFRRDLRLHDNPALWEATLQGVVFPIFIWSKEEEFEYYNNSASTSWLHHSLTALKDNLAAEGLTLTIRTGDTFDELNTFAKETNADALFFNERYERTIRDRDKRIASLFANGILEVKTFNGHLLFPPNLILNKKNEPYKVFTSFWKRTMHETIASPLPIPLDMKGSKLNYPTVSVDALGLVPSNHWDDKLMRQWNPGEKNGILHWSSFLDFEPDQYLQERDFPAHKATSSLSPYLASGDLSIRAIWHSANTLGESSESVTLHESLQALKRQLIWREFAYHLLIHHPKMDSIPLRDPFLQFPWRDSKDDLNTWKKGMTGYPLVDAGMRELWETGVIHNRVRMVVASFLVKHLLIEWKEGHDWFKETLIDLDVAINAMGWQWVTGCGIDSAPYFRIFNPILQSEKFDPKGDYLRKWIPELAALPNKFIHKPWEAPVELLQEAGIDLGTTYPKPMIDHSFARQRALHAFSTIKNRK